MVDTISSRCVVLRTDLVVKAESFSQNIGCFIVFVSAVNGALNGGGRFLTWSLVIEHVIDVVDWLDLCWLLNLGRVSIVIALF